MADLSSSTPFTDPDVDALLAALVLTAGSLDGSPVKVTLLVSGRLIRGEVASPTQWAAEAGHHLRAETQLESLLDPASAGEHETPATKFVHLCCAYAPGTGPTPPLRIKLSQVGAWAIGYAD